MKRSKPKCDDFSRHEVYDRASVVLDLFCASVAGHPVVSGDKILAAEAEKVTDALYQFYNSAAEKLMPHGTGEARKRRGAKTSAGAKS
jgi:hypothetical protein